MIVREGTLEKKSEGNANNWHERYFQMDGKELRYYFDHKDAK
jgi:hypothetical protein